MAAETDLPSKKTEKKKDLCVSNKWVVIDFEKKRKIFFLLISNAHPI